MYRGMYEGNAVAVKVIDKVHLDDARKQKQKREMEEHFRLDHENVLKLLHVDELRDKTYKLIGIYQFVSIWYHWWTFSISFTDASCSNYVPGH